MFQTIVNRPDQDKTYAMVTAASILLAVVTAPLLYGMVQAALYAFI